MCHGILRPALRRRPHSPTIDNNQSNAGRDFFFETKTIVVDRVQASDWRIRAVVFRIGNSQLKSLHFCMRFIHQLFFPMVKTA